MKLKLIFMIEKFIFKLGCSNSKKSVKMRSKQHAYTHVVKSLRYQALSRSRDQGYGGKAVLARASWHHRKWSSLSAAVLEPCSTISLSPYYVAIWPRFFVAWRRSLQWLQYSHHPRPKANITGDGNFTIKQIQLYQLWTFFFQSPHFWAIFWFLLLFIKLLLFILRRNFSFDV